MNFLYPTFLSALVFIAIPIIIHLFNFRRFKKIYFTNVKFLREVKEETASRTKLKHWLVLLSRILAIAFLVFAFAQPYIPVTEQAIKAGKKAISIYLDNSFSMNASGEEQELFYQASLKAKEVISAFGVEDEFQIITNDFEARHQRLLSRDEVLSLIDEIELSPNVRRFSEVLSRQKQALAKSDAEDHLLFYLSDFQENIVDIEADTSLQMFFIPFQSPLPKNVYLDTAWMASPVIQLNQSNRLIVRLVNTGEENIDNARLTLEINGKTKGLTDFSIQAGKSILDTLSFSVSKPGGYSAKLGITDFPITFDDDYYIAFKVAENSKVLSINEQNSNPYIKALFAENDYFILDNQSSKQLDYSSLSNYQLIILNNLNVLSSGLAFELKSFVEDGGALLIFPGEKLSATSFNSFLKTLNADDYLALNSKQQAVVKIFTEHRLFQGVFEEIPSNLKLPLANKYYSFSSYSRSAEPLMKLRNGQDFLTGYPFGRGNLFLSAVPLDRNFTDFPVHGIFLPIVYRMALSSYRTGDLSYILGDGNIIETDNLSISAESVYRLEYKGNVFIPAQKAVGSKMLITIPEQVKKAGIYTLSLPEQEEKKFIALNYDRMESDLKYIDEEVLAALSENSKISLINSKEANFSQVVSQLNQGVTLWKLCLILALLFLAMEILLLRFLPGV